MLSRDCAVRSSEREKRRWTKEEHQGFENSKASVETGKKAEAAVAGLKGATSVSFHTEGAVASGFQILL